MASEEASLKRKRTRLACGPCRDRKRKCDGQSPCSTCTSWGYDCHYSRPVRPRPSTPDRSQSNPIIIPDNSPSDHGRGGRGSHRTEALEANSAAAFVRKIALKIDPYNAPKMNLFGWNVGKRKSPVRETFRQTLDEVISATTLQTLGRRYFEKIHPCYGFIDAAQFYRRLDARWQPTATENTYDGVLAGVAALGALFSGTAVDGVESSLAELVRRISDTHLGTAAPSLDLLTVWTLRVVYLRMTAAPYPAWAASSTLMHLIEASKLHQVWSNDEPDLDIRRRLIGVAEHLNIWISYDLGLSRVPLNHDAIGLPTPTPGDATVELLGLLPVTESLGPENQRHDQEIEHFLLETLDRTHTLPPSLLAQCNLTLCLLRRLRLTNLTTTPTTMNRVMDLLRRSLSAVRQLVTEESPWQHVANVPFQMISILLEMDTSASLAVLPDAMQTLKLVATTYNTERMREAFTTAYLLITLYEARRKEDSRLLNGIVRSFTVPDPEPPSGLDEVTWIKGVVADVPTLQGFDLEQYFDPDMVRFSPDFQTPEPMQSLQPMEPVDLITPPRSYIPRTPDASQ